jgi:hypothetical protein
MSRIVSLSKAKKLRERTKKRAQADENAVKFGRTKAEKELEKARSAKAARDFNWHERGS